MAYRNFTNAPAWTRDGSRDTTDTDSWIDWMVEDKLIHDFAPRPTGSCSMCGAPMTGTWARCYQCTLVGRSLDVLIPASYSLDNGLESLVKAYKDFGHGWAGAPLASLLSAVFERHGECIERELGASPVYTWVPSNDISRGFDHLELLVNAPENVASLPWAKDVVVRVPSVPRPRPGKDKVLVNAEAYDAHPSLKGRTVLLLDDLYTSGASMGSTAAALKAVGVTKVVGLVLGRQLRRGNDYGNSEAVFAEVETRGWNFDECVACT